MSDEEFFDIVDSHPMTDEEAMERIQKIVYSNLPYYDEYLEVIKGHISANTDWLVDYKNYGNAWSNFVLSHADTGGLRSLNAESRKKLIELEELFESVKSNWLEE